MNSPYSNQHRKVRNVTLSQRFSELTKTAMLLVLLVCSDQLVASNANAPAAKALGARLGASPEYTRSVLDLHRDVEFIYFFPPDLYTCIIDMS